jgi:hypothetical protein
MKTSSSNRARGRSRSRGGEVIDNHGALSESSTTLSTHPSLGRPFAPSLPDNSSQAEADANEDTLHKDPTDWNPRSKHAGSVHQLETPKSSVHQAPVTSLGWTDSPVVDSVANSIAKSDASGNAVRRFYLWVSLNSLVLIDI